MKNREKYVKLLLDVTNRALTHATQFLIRRCMAYMKQDIGGHFLYKNVYRRALEWIDLLSFYIFEWVVNVPLQYINGFDF